MNLPLPAHQLTLDEIIQYADNPVAAVLIARIEELETELEEEEKARDADDDRHSLALGAMEEKLEACKSELARVENMYDKLETRFLKLKESASE